MSKPLLVIVASAPTMAELRRRRDAAALAGADLVELRLDSVADPDVAAALAGRTTPGHRDVPAGVGRRARSRTLRPSGGGFSSVRFSKAPNTSTSSSRRGSPPI